MKLNFRTVAAATVLSLGAAQSLAATQIGEHLTFSGFGTLGVVHSDTDEGQFVRGRQLTGAADNDLEFNVDSNMGAQLTATATSWLSGTVQLLAAHRLEENIDIEAEWAFVKLAPLNGLEIRGGRMSLPTFAISDFRNVGYANTWIRPPDEVYALAILNRLEGADATYRLPIGSTSLTVSVLAGKSELETSFFKLDVDNVKGFNVLWETDWVSLRAGRVRGEPQLPGGDVYTFSGVGAIVDRDNIVAQAEYVTRRSENEPAGVDADGWYVLGGYRFGSILPYVMYGHTAPKEAGPAHLSYDQSTIAAGVRWDAFKSAAFKFQVQHVDTNDTSGVSFVTPALPPPAPPAAFAPITDSVTVLSLALDFVF